MFPERHARECWEDSSLLLPTLQLGKDLTSHGQVALDGSRQVLT